MTPLHQMMDLSDTFSQQIDKFHEHLVIIIEIVMWLMYYLSMIYISLDKMFIIRFHLKYPIYCSLARAKILLATTWTFVVCLFVSVLILHIAEVSDYYPYIWYVYFVLDVVFIGVAVSTFAFIFNKYNNTRIPPSVYPTSSMSKKLLHTSFSSRFKSFRRSSFFIVVLRILSFLVFKVSSNLLFFFVSVPNNGDNLTVSMIVFLMWAISDLLDGLMNILQNKSLFKECKKNLNQFSRILRVSFNATANHTSMNSQESSASSSPSTTEIVVQRKSPEIETLVRWNQQRSVTLPDTPNCR